MNYFAFFELEEPYTNNRIYNISFKNSKPITFVYNELNIISHAIKINQNGYSPLVKNIMLMSEDGWELLEFFLLILGQIKPFIYTITPQKKKFMKIK